MKKQYFVARMERVVYVDPMFVKKAGQLDTEECELYDRLLEKYPDFKFEVKKLNESNKQTYKGLTIKVMQAIIIQHEETPDKYEPKLKELNKKLADGLARNATYSVAKSWFLDNYGEVYTGSALSKKEGKREALINELLSKVDKSIIAPASKVKGVESNG